MKARVSHLHRTESEWLKLANWKPEAGELIIYDPDSSYSYARLKVGDGQTSLKDLPFLIDVAAEAMILKHQSLNIFDSGRITDFMT